MYPEKLLYFESTISFVEALCGGGRITYVCIEVIIVRLPNIHSKAFYHVQSLTRTRTHLPAILQRFNGLFIGFIHPSILCIQCIY